MAGLQRFSSLPPPVLQCDATRPRQLAATGLSRYRAMTACHGFPCHASHHISQSHNHTSVIVINF